MAAYSVIFTLAAGWLGLIDSRNENISTLKIFHPNLAEQSPQCSPAQQFIDSVRFEECRSGAWSRVTERPPPYLESVYNNNKVRGGLGQSYNGRRQIRVLAGG